MKLTINPEGGMAGDMFAAALVSAGADFKLMKSAMEAAGKKLGAARITINQTTDRATQLLIQLESQRRHLGTNEARAILSDLFEDFGVRDKYRAFGLKCLEILAKAEKRAHREFNIVIEGDQPHTHHHHHGHNHEHDHDHEHDHEHDHHHHHGHAHDHEESFLHEAQDIVIDIVGAVMGMEQLNVEPGAELLRPVSVGGGHVHCSHGTLAVPAPATSVILEEYHIEWRKGPIEKELFTPTGAAILAGLGARLNSAIDIKSLDIAATGRSRGSKILDIPPFEIYLV